MSKHTEAAQTRETKCNPSAGALGGLVELGPMKEHDCALDALPVALEGFVRPKNQQHHL